MRLEKNSRRALRRHHRERMMRKAHRLAMTWWSGCSLYVYQGELRRLGDTLEEYREWSLRYAQRHHNDLAVCSCYMCGNPPLTNAKTNRLT